MLVLFTLCSLFFILLCLNIFILFILFFKVRKQSVEIICVDFYIFLSFFFHLEPPQLLKAQEFHINLSTLKEMTSSTDAQSSAYRQLWCGPFAYLGKPAISVIWKVGCQFWARLKGENTIRIVVD